MRPDLSARPRGATLSTRKKALRDQWEVFWLRNAPTFLSINWSQNAYRTPESIEALKDAYSYPAFPHETYEMGLPSSTCAREAASRRTRFHVLPLASQIKRTTCLRQKWKPPQLWHSKPITTGKRRTEDIGRMLSSTIVLPSGVALLHALPAHTTTPILGKQKPPHDGWWSIHVLWWWESNSHGYATANTWLHSHRSPWSD